MSYLFGNNSFGGGDRTLRGGDGGGGGGGAQQVTSTSTTSNIPDWLKEPTQRMVARGETLSQQPYQMYGGQRIADFTPAQQESFKQIYGMQTPGEYGAAGSAIGAGANAAFGYDPAQFSSAAARAYMSPYQQNVTDIAKREAVAEAAGLNKNLAAQASKAGAFGGSRFGIEQALLGSKLATNLSDIQTKGSQAAFENAQQQFERDRAARAGAAQLQAQTGLQAGTQLANLGTARQAADLQRIGALQTAGQQVQQQQQQRLDQAYADFVNKRDFERQQLQFLSGLIRGAPYGTQSEVTTGQSAPSTASQIASLGLGAYGLSSLFGKKEGGEIKAYAKGGHVEDDDEQSDVDGYAEGGVTGIGAMRPLKNISDQILNAAAAGKVPQIPQEDAIAEQNMRRMIRTSIAGRRAGTELEDGRSVLEKRLPEETGLGAVPVRNMNFAEGGIARFNGEEESYVETPLSRFGKWYTGTAVPYVGKKMLSMATAGAPETAEDILAAKQYLTTPTTRYKAPKDMNETQASAYEDARSKGYTPEAARSFATDPKVQNYVKQYGNALSKSTDFSTFQADPSKYVEGRLAQGAKDVEKEKKDLQAAQRGDGGGGGAPAAAASKQQSFFDVMDELKKRYPNNYDDITAALKEQKEQIAQARQDTKGIAALRMAQGFAAPGKVKGIFGLTGLSEALGGAAEEGQRAIVQQQAAEQALMSQKLQMQQLKEAADKGDMTAAAALYEAQMKEPLIRAQANFYNQRGAAAGMSGGLNPRLYTTLMGQVDKATKDYIARNPGATNEQIQVFQQQDMNRRIRMVGGKGLGDTEDIGFAVPGKGATIRE